MRRMRYTRFVHLWEVMLWRKFSNKQTISVWQNYLNEDDISNVNCERSYKKTDMAEYYSTEKFQLHCLCCLLIIVITKLRSSWEWETVGSKSNWTSYVVKGRGHSQDPQGWGQGLDSSRPRPVPSRPRPRPELLSPEPISRPIMSHNLLPIYHTPLTWRLH